MLPSLMVFLSTLSLRRATRPPCSSKKYTLISIHALLAESDLGFCCCLFGGLVFLSTLSLRRATRPWWKCRAFRLYFYPRSPCGERHINTDSFSRVMLFLSTLSLRRATAGCELEIPTQEFLSTLSLRRATGKLRNPSRPGKINFYPRSPCGERRPPFAR